MLGDIIADSRATSPGIRKGHYGDGGCLLIRPRDEDTWRPSHENLEPPSGAPFSGSKYSAKPERSTNAKLS